MRINPSEIKVDYGNGRIVTLRNDANWERTREYIDRLFQWDKSYPGDPTEIQEQDLAASTATITSAIINTSPTPTLDSSLRIVDRMIIVLGRSGGALTVHEIFQGMVADGYVNQATKAENNIHSKVRKYPSYIKMSSGRVILLDAGWEHFRQLEANGFRFLPNKTISEFDVKIRALERQYAEQRQDDQQRGKPEVVGMDYLLLALYKLGGSAALRDLIDPMIEYGWQPASSTYEKKLHNVSALVFTSKLYVNREKGWASINNNGLERLTNQVKAGVLKMDAEDAQRLFQQNSPTTDLEESNAGLFVQA